MEDDHLPLLFFSFPFNKEIEHIYEYYKFVQYLIYIQIARSEILCVCCFGLFSKTLASIDLNDTVNMG